MNENISMGPGKLANCNNVLARKFRWTMESKYLDSKICSKVKIDNHFSTITLRLIDIIFPNDTNPQPNSLYWISKLNTSEKTNDTLVFTTYDGVGCALYRQTFDGLSLIQHTCKFDYADSDVVSRKVMVRFYKTTCEFYNEFNSEINDVLAAQKCKTQSPIEILNLWDEAELSEEKIQINFLNSTINL